MQSDLATTYRLMEHEERLKRIEEKLFKNKKRPGTSRGQQMLLMKQLGCLDPILQLEISQEKKALLLSIILNADHDNIYNDLVHLNEPVNTLNIERNYQFLINTYKEIGLKKLEEEADAKLDEIKKLKDSKTGKK
jgi:hypothetical protein